MIQNIVLAAGQSTRMGGKHKLLLPLGGQLMIRHVVSMSSELGPKPIVVTGYQADKVQMACEGIDCTFVHNDNFSNGMAYSLKTGITALSSDVSGALILLGDMPLITSEHCLSLITAARSHPDCAIRASHQGQAGNPVILPSSIFEPIASLKGDIGAQALIKQLGLTTKFVEIGDAALMDADTPEAYDALSARF